MGESAPELAALLPDAWLVGGAVRDRLLGRETHDFDLVVPGDPRAAAQRVAQASGAFRFALSDGWGAWRLIARDRSWQVDLMPLTGETIEADLGRRDLTINAIAEPLAGGDPVDPFGGREDLAARRLRMVSPQAFTDDPLRVMRLARQACELGFAAEGATVTAAAAAAPGLAGVAGERIFAELKRIVGAAGVLAGLALMERVGATAVVLPELTALRGVGQSVYHHLDVHDHTLLVLEETVRLQQEPAAVFPDDAGDVSRLLAEPLADELTRGDALRFAALLHDAAKPQTRGVTAEGRVSFIGHDTAGAELARAVVARLRASEKLADTLAALIREHLRLGFLVRRRPLSPHDVYGYCRATSPVAADVTLLTVADRLATRGRSSERAIAAHLELARELLPATLRWRAEPPQAPIRGDRLAEAIGIRPGPELGRLLAELTEARYAGEITSEADAISFARRVLER